MATSLLALLDDITTVLDDIAVLTKLSAKKTAGVLGDDLALNAQQVTGVQSNREIPVVLAVAKGSLINKSILVPLALAISAIASDMSDAMGHSAQAVTELADQAQVLKGLISSMQEQPDS